MVLARDFGRGAAFTAQIWALVALLSVRGGFGSPWRKCGRSWRRIFVWVVLWFYGSGGGRFGCFRPLRPFGDTFVEMDDFVDFWEEELIC